MLEIIKTINLETWLLAISAGFFLYLLYSWHTDKNTSLDVRTLVMTGDKLSLAKMGQFIAMIVSTWVIIYQTRATLLTEWLFTGYMLAWAGAGVAGKLIDKTADK